MCSPRINCVFFIVCEVGSGKEEKDTFVSVTLLSDDDGARCDELRSCFRSMARLLVDMPSFFIHFNHISFKMCVHRRIKSRLQITKSASSVIVSSFFSILFFPLLIFFWIFIVKEKNISW